MTPEFFYFDLGNVLVNFDHRIAVRQMAQVCGVGAKIIRQIVFDSDLQTRYETGLVTGQEVYEFVCSGVERVSDGPFERPAYKALRYAGSAIFALNMPVVPIVAQLKRAGHRLGVLSNTCESHWEYCIDQYAIVSELFDVHLLSYEVKSMKPDRPIYAAAMDAAKASPEKIFFVDDRPENVAGAVDAGFDAVQFTTSRQLACDLRDRGVLFDY